LITTEFTHHHNLQDAKRARRLEALKKNVPDTSVKSPEPYNMPWKQKYQRTFHVKKRFLLGAADGIEIELHNDTFNCDEGGNITGDLVRSIRSLQPNLKFTLDPSGCMRSFSTSYLTRHLRMSNCVGESFHKKKRERSSNGKS